jgi:transglutaminase-like putative cysteine protease
MRGVSGLNLYSPDGGTDGLQDVRPDFTNIHVWAEVEFPGIGWVEVEPAGGDDAYEIPARYIQNNKWFQNYEVYFEEGGEWKEPDWNLVQGRWVSPFQLEHIVTYRAKTLAANKRRVP